MASTLLLDLENWDLVLGANGNIAVASQPYSLAQDAASSIKTFQGECWWDTTFGVPYLSEVLGHQPSVSLLKALFEAAALEVDDVARAQVFITTIDVPSRRVTGQVQVTSQTTGEISVATFSVTNPQEA
jgi:hypothetical protein